MNDRPRLSEHSPAVANRVETYAWSVVKRPWLVVFASLVVAAVLTGGAARLTATNDFRAFFGPDNPELAELERFEQTYERQQNLLIVVIADPATVFSMDGLTLIHALTEMGWRTPYSRRVTSLTNFQHTEAREDEVVVAALLDEPDGLDPDAIERIKDIALGEPALVGRIVSSGGLASVVNIALTLPIEKPDANAEVVAFATAHIERLRIRFPDIEIAIGGTTATDIALGEAVARDVQSLVGLSYLVIAVGLMVLLRHLGGTLATLMVVTLAIVTTMGVFGWLNATLEATAGFVPSIVMTIAVADSVHILSTFYYEMRRGRAREAAVVEALRINAGPVALTSITTAIGVLMLNFSDSPPYNELGNMVAVGVVAAWLLSMTFLPAVLMLIPVHHPERGKRLELWMSSFAEWLIGNRRALLIGMGTFILVLASFIPSNRIGERWHEYFDETFAVQRAIDGSAKYLGGLHVIQFNLQSGTPDGIHDPAYLTEIEQFARWLLKQPEVTHVDRLTELLARLNMNMHGDDPATRRTPDSRELAAQLLLLYELSLPLGMGLENTIDLERSGSRMTVSLRRTSSEALLAFDARAQAWLATNAPHIQPTVGTGIDLIFANINHRNIKSLLIGMVVALILISIVLIVALRSVKLGILSLVTNLAPAGLAYGTWALFNGQIDLSASVVICMSIGIVVDDTVHFLSKYRRAREEAGLDAADALRYAFHTVGVALTVTTLVLVAGFTVLTASHFHPTVTTGTLMAITLAYALVVDFLFLPPLLLTVDKSTFLHSGADRAAARS